jgi:hypothetical protein
MRVRLAVAAHALVEVRRHLLAILAIHEREPVREHRDALGGNAEQLHCSPVSTMRLVGGSHS